MGKDFQFWGINYLTFGGSRWGGSERQLKGDILAAWRAGMAAIRSAAWAQPVLEIVSDFMEL